MERSIAECEEDERELEGRMARMCKEQNATQEELELIGRYVDQLKDRLANFAAARKELEAQEEVSQALEAEAAKYAEEAEHRKREAEALTRKRGKTKVFLASVGT